MIPATWTPHRREDGERVGWIRPEGDAWVAIDALGREASDPIEWLDAEAVLEQRGLAWLADVWMLEDEGASPVRVRLVEIVPAAGRVVVQTDDYGAIDVPVTRYELAWPAPAALRPLEASDGDFAPPFG